MLEEIIIRTLCDTLPPVPTDAVYLFAQTTDNQESSFRTARYLLQQGITEKVCFINTCALSGYPGYKAWEEALLSSGLNAENIKPVPPVPADTTILHTRIEAESFVSFSKQQNYKSVILSAPPFHQPRAFMAAVTASQIIYPELKLYSYPGQTMPWQQEVTHSQGEVQSTRSGLIAGEIERIHKYQAKGDLESVGEVLLYMNNRDK